MSMFTTEQIKTAFKEEQQKMQKAGKKAEKPGLALALIILGNSSIGKKQRSGEDFAQHPMHVATQNIRSRTKRVIAILHDVIEDSRKENPEYKWTLEDLKEIGFSKRIRKAIKGLTKQPDELYLDFIVRCGLSGDDAIKVKIEDIAHNSDPTRYRTLSLTSKQQKKQALYNLAYHYLVDLKKKRDDGTPYNTPGTSIVDYIKSRKEYKDQAGLVNALLDEFSSEKGRLKVKKGLAKNFNP